MHTWIKWSDFADGYIRIVLKDGASVFDLPAHDVLPVDIFAALCLIQFHEFRVGHEDGRVADSMSRYLMPVVNRPMINQSPEANAMLFRRDTGIKATKARLNDLLTAPTTILYSAYCVRVSTDCKEDQTLLRIALHEYRAPDI